MKLVWNDDITACGRYSINSEHVRGEPRYYWLHTLPREAQAHLRSLDEPASGYVCGSFQMSHVKREAQKLEDIITTGETP